MSTSKLHDQINVKVTTALSTKLRQIAASKKVTLGAAVREILEAHFDEIDAGKPRDLSRA